MMRCASNANLVSEQMCFIDAVFGDRSSITISDRQSVTICDPHRPCITISDPESSDTLLKLSGKPPHLLELVSQEAMRYFVQQNLPY